MTQAEFPKIIYAFWMQGRENAPEIVQINFDRWERLNPDYKMIVFDEDSAREFLADFPIDASKLAVQAFADILRMQLLRKNGGVWTDASVYPTTPLSVWLAPYMERNTFFAYDSQFPEHDKHGIVYQPVLNWFIAARVGCRLMEKWCDLMERYWFMERESLQQETLGDFHRPPIYHPEDIDAEMGLPDMRPTSHYPYFWPHHLFGHLLHHDSDFATQWDAVKGKNSELATAVTITHKKMYLYPFFYPPIFRAKSFKNKMRWMFKRITFPLFKPLYLRQELSRAPMQKLNWRFKKYPLKLLKNYPL